MNLSEWESKFAAKISEVATADDPAHDLLHFQRVVAMAKYLAAQEGGNLEVIIPAAWLHDLVIVPKDSPLRNQASRLSGEKAIEFLRSIDYPAKFFDEIAHAIAGHSFSAKLEVKTIEAKIVQDADRLDGLGAIGIARCFATAGLLKRPFYSSDDPFCEVRHPDDRRFTVDHFFLKLFKTADTMQTEAGHIEGRKRTEIMKNYLASFRSEVLI